MYMILKTIISFPNTFVRLTIISVLKSNLAKLRLRLNLMLPGKLCQSNAQTPSNSSHVMFARSDIVKLL